MTILYHKGYENITKSKGKALASSTQSIVLADCALQAIGKCGIQINIGNSEFEFTIVVADINTDGILSLDFLKKNRCLVDVASAKMYIGESEHELQMKGHLGCFNVSLKETVYQPPRSEMVCPDSLSLFSIKQRREQIIVGPPEDLKKRQSACSQCGDAFAKSSRLVRQQKRIHC